VRYHIANPNHLLPTDPAGQHKLASNLLGSQDTLQVKKKYHSQIKNDPDFYGDK